jgi:hypothetical protein
MKRITTYIVIVLFFAAAFGYPAITFAGDEPGGTIYLPVITKPEEPEYNTVVNGTFEAGRTGWLEYEDSPFFDIALIVRKSDLPLGISPQDGNWTAWLGGESDLITYIQQDVFIPVPGLELVYWYWIDSISNCDSSHGGVTINDVAQEQFFLCSTTSTGGWVRSTVNLDAYTSQMVGLRFYSQTDQNNYTSFYIDSVSIQKTP